MNKKKEYLGDGVYVEIVNDQIVLTTENGVDITNIIYLEPQVLTNLFEYVG